MSSGNNTYRFILTPLDTVFFGGEKSPFKEEYFRKSNCFPQQTTILGFLRYEILKRTGFLGNNDRSKWDSVIGKSSWNGIHNQTFGLIEKISPVSVYSKKDRKDLFVYRNPSGLSPVHRQIACCYGEENNSDNKVMYFEKDNTYRFDAKNHDHFGEILTDFNGFIKNIECDIDEEKRKNYDIEVPELSKAVFIRDVQPGITKNYEGVVKDKGYYKTLYWRMVKDYAYSFKAIINPHKEKIDWEGSSIVTFGGESSKYLLEVKSNETWSDVPTNIEDIIVLTSDACVSDNIYSSCHFAVSEGVNFRNLKTTNNDKNYTKRPVLKWYREPGRSGRNTEPAQVLMKKGSILFIKDKDKFLKAINYPAFQKIGYNYFKTFKNLYQTR